MDAQNHIAGRWWSERRASDRRSVERIAILRALYFGDFLCAVPAWRALRAAFPNACITLIGLSWARSLAARFPRYIDEFVEFPGYPGLPEQDFCPADVLDFFSKMHARQFDLALQMHGSGRYVNEVISLLGARSQAGFYLPGEYCPDLRNFIPYPDTISEVHRHLSLMSALGIPLKGDDLEYPVTPAERDAFWARKEIQTLREKPYVCLHPGGRGANRRWRPDYFGRIADRLLAHDLEVVITGMQGEEAIGEAVMRSMNGVPLSLIGRTDLAEVGVLMESAALLVANDTGVSHVASALRLPSVIICTGSDPQRWGPLDRQRHRVLTSEEATIESVWEQVEELLSFDRRVLEVEPCEF